MPRYGTLPAIACLLITSALRGTPSQNPTTASPVAAAPTASPTAAAPTASLPAGTATPKTSTPSEPRETTSPTLSGCRLSKRAWLDRLRALRPDTRRHDADLRR